MSLLSIRNLEKNKGNTILFPEFSLEVNKGDIVAIKCNSEVGRQIIDMLIGQVSLSNGEVIFKDESLNTNYKKLSRSIGIALLDESFYDRLNLDQYLKFFKRLYAVETDISSLLQQTGLIEKKKIQIKNLTFSEKKRLQVARVILPEPELIIFEEPNQNVDIESKIIIQQIVSNLSKQGKAILITTNYFENAISFTDIVYSLDKEGFKRIEVRDKDDVKEETSNSDIDNLKKVENKTNIPFNPQVRFEKIPAKVNEKIILFDPTEISYIESNEGVCNLYVKGEMFSCSYTLKELLDRLQAFGFFRCHRSYIVNLQKVREVITWTRNSYSLILDDSKKTNIPLSKNKLSELKDIIGI
ncbi:LytTR family transcriptional regulator DNA-binding domain-containing protein [Priestia megaterium]|uniref:LytTR family transcriptional regulator DNA-binding domain-containing protein n=2 Tax=Priestia megaterium TaxID=1404 RepID=UPI000CA3B770|nr:LytTR family transcriptional regulator DNA-binding domain-containing protein [Priestia megaterium]AUO14647.1 LytR family transcriptional regulator [Priestia megaterium]